MDLDLQTIFGFSVGFEIADQETREMLNMEWGFVIDFLILRLVINKFKE